MTPTTRRYPRGLREAFPSTMDWWEGRSEPHHVISFGGAMKPRKKLPAARAIYLSNGIVARLLRWVRLTCRMRRGPL